MTVSKNRDHGSSSTTVLLMEPDLSMLENIVLLLSASKFGVIGLKSYIDLLDLKGDYHFRVALISDRFDTHALRKVAGCIRHRWPATKIVITGRHWPELEDNLYDETFDHHFQPQKLIDTLWQWLAECDGEP
jgi:hypothetical protein